MPRRWRDRRSWAVWGKTGRATIIIGAFLVAAALVPALAGLLFLIPVPLLAAMLLFDSWRMMKLIEHLDGVRSIGVAVTVSVVSFFSHNLTSPCWPGSLSKNRFRYSGRHMFIPFQTNYTRSKLRE